MFLQPRECPTSSTPITTPAPPPILVQSCRDGESFGRASTGDQYDKKGATPKPTHSAPPKSGPHPRDGGTISAANDTAPEGTVMKWSTGTAKGGSGASLPAPAQAPDTLRFPLSGSLPCAKILEPDAATWNPEVGPSVPLSSTPRQRCTLPLEDGVCGAGQPIVVKKTLVARFPRNAQLRPSGLQTTAAPSSSEKRSAAAGFTVSGYVAPAPAAQHQQAKPERGLHTKAIETDQGLHGPRNEASTTETADGKHQPLFNDLSSDQIIHVPVAPTCRPPSWEGPSDSIARRNPVEPSSSATRNARKRYRQGLTAAAAVVSEKLRAPPPGWTPPTLGGGSGVGTAAAVAANDVQYVMPAIPVPRAMVQPGLVADLVDMVSRSPSLSLSPPATRGRAFGVISPLSWSSADAGIGRLLSTPRIDSRLCLRRAAAAATNSEGGTTPFRNSSSGSSGAPVASSSAAFFPVRPRAGRHTPVLTRRARCLRAEAR